MYKITRSEPTAPAVGIPVELMVGRLVEKRQGFSMKMTIGGRYNWRGQPERLVYLGDNLSGNGYWHQFAKVERPDVVWCEVKGNKLDHFEETAPKNLNRPCGAICAGQVRDGLECSPGQCAVRETPN